MSCAKALIEKIFTIYGLVLNFIIFVLGLTLLIVGLGASSQLEEIGFDVFIPTGIFDGIAICGGIVLFTSCLGCFAALKEIQIIDYLNALITFLLFIIFFAVGLAAMTQAEEAKSLIEAEASANTTKSGLYVCQAWRACCLPDRNLEYPDPADPFGCVDPVKELVFELGCPEPVGGADTAFLPEQFKASGTACANYEAFYGEFGDMLMDHTENIAYTVLIVASVFFCGFFGAVVDIKIKPSKKGDGDEVAPEP